jgi:hypothetical protein
MSVEDRFWSKVDRSGRCWHWTASTGRQGYGRFTVLRGVVVRAHHFAWALLRGPLPESARVLQRCGDRLCVRAEHLYLGARVRSSSRRRRRPVRAPVRRRPSDARRRLPARVRRDLALLAPLDVRTIRLVHSIGGEPAELARLLGVSETAIREILRSNLP